MKSKYLKPYYLSQALEAGLKAGLKAGQKIIEIYKTSFSVEMKDDNSPLTLADKESHRIISESLAVTGVPILSEEGSFIPYETRKEWGCIVSRLTLVISRGYAGNTTI